MGFRSNSAGAETQRCNGRLRIDNSGAFVHSAPWSVGDQGKRTSVTAASTSPRTARSGSTTFGSGDPIVVKDSVGLYNNPDGADATGGGSWS